jgi:hypothetical protein
MTTADKIAEVAARAHRRNAHQQAGYAVAAAARGGQLQDIYIGVVLDWSDPGSDELPGATHHRSKPRHQPFITYAGVWACAKFESETNSELEVEVPRSFCRAIPPLKQNFVRPYKVSRRGPRSSALSRKVLNRNLNRRRITQTMNRKMTTVTKLSSLH